MSWALPLEFITVTMINPQMIINLIKPFCSFLFFLYLMTAFDLNTLRHCRSFNNWRFFTFINRNKTNFHQQKTKRKPNQSANTEKNYPCRLRVSVYSWSFPNCTNVQCHHKFSFWCKVAEMQREAALISFFISQNRKSISVRENVLLLILNHPKNYSHGRN